MPLRFFCEVCNLQVTCQDTLENHRRGRDHIKRELKRREEEARLLAGGGGGGGSDADMIELRRNRREELALLREEVRQLRFLCKNFRAVCEEEHGDYGELAGRRASCVRNHSAAAVAAAAAAAPKKEEEKVFKVERKEDVKPFKKEPLW